MPRVSAIIPCYNGARTLPAALDSALAQSWGDYELIIVDDGSSDESERVSRQYCEKHPGKIRYFKQENQGPAAARNTAIENSSGELLALLDCDDLWMPDRLAEGVRALDGRPGAALAHANIVRVNENLEFIDIPGRDERYLGGKIFDHLYTRRAHVACPTALFRRSAIERVGAFDSRVSCIGCEDRELWLRIAREFETVYIARELAQYRVSSASVSHNLEKMLRARHYVMDKHARSVSTATRREAYAALYREMGESYADAGAGPSARRYFWKAAQANPWSARSAAGALWHCVLGK